LLALAQQSANPAVGQAHLLPSSYKLVVQTLHSDIDVEPVLAVINLLGQIVQDEPSRKKPTLQIH